MSTVSDVKTIVELAAIGAIAYGGYKLVTSSPVKQVTDTVTEFVEDVSDAVQQAPETIQGMNTAAQVATETYVNEVSKAAEDEVVKITGKAATQYFWNWLNGNKGEIQEDGTIVYNSESALKTNAAMQTIKAVGDFAGSAVSGATSFFKSILGIKD